MPYCLRADGPESSGNARMSVRWRLITSARSARTARETGFRKARARYIEVSSVRGGSGSLSGHPIVKERGTHGGGPFRGLQDVDDEALAPLARQRTSKVIADRQAQAIGVLG